MEALGTGEGRRNVRTDMRVLSCVVWLLALVVLVGCSGGRDTTSNAGATSAKAPIAEGSVDAESADASLASVQKVTREIIRTASLTVEVKDLAEAELLATKWVLQSQGYVEATASNNLNSVRASLSMTLRVPVDKFDQAIGTFEGYGTLVSKSIESEDVTTQLVDLRARLTVLREQEKVLLGFLRESKSLKDSLAVNQELTRVRQEIESMDAIRRSQEQLAALSTIVVEFRSPAQVVQRSDSKAWANDAWTDSTNSLIGLGRGVGRFGISLLVFAPIWLPLVAGGIWWMRRRRNLKPSA